MGNTCTNCNCNKDDRDEFKLDDKLAQNQAIAGANRQHLMGSDTYLNETSQIDGGYNVQRVDQRSRAFAANTIGGLEPTSTFDDHHYAHQRSDASPQFE